MKTKLKIYTVSAIAICICAGIVIKNFSRTESNLEKEFEERESENEAEEKEEESGADKQLSMWFQARAYPEPYNLNEKYQRAWEQEKKLREEGNRIATRTNSAANWASLGPSSNGGTLIGGRIKCIAIDPNNTNNLWAGSASGGIWKSTNAGTSWTSVPTGLHVLGVSSILVDPAASNTIYAGTGEVYRVDTSNIGFNVWKARGTYGIGIIKSTDGGVSWSQVMVKNTAQMFAIQNLMFDPTTSNTIYACATDGLYRSTNNGINWSQILAKTYVKDIAINPTNTNQIVVSIGNMVNSDKGIYRTINGNTAAPAWTKITSGLPASFEGSILLDNAGATELVASIGMSSSTAASNREVYRSTDFGTTWAVVGGTTATTTTNHCSYQFWFAHTVAINPFFTDSIMFGGVGLYRYKVSTTALATVSGVHSDNHDIKFDPINRGRIYVCCDGGIYKSTNGGSTFTAINSGLNATQFYASLGVSTTTANKMIGGLQDNGQVMYNGTQWNSISWGGGDGTSCAIDPSSDLNILASRDAKQVFRSTNGGTTGGSVTAYWGFSADSRTGFVAPLAFSKSSPTTVYLASDNLHKSTNGGGTFTNDAFATATNYIEAQNKTAIALAVSATNANKVYVSTSPFAQKDNDVSGLIITGQPNILKTTTGGTPFASIKGTLPDRFVQDIAISPTNDDSVFIVLGGFGTAHVYVTGNGGTSWTALGGIGSSGRTSAVLPDVPFNAIVFDPVNSNIIYAGSDFGVYVSADRGASWLDYNTGFTDVNLVMDLQISADGKLVAATHGKGVFKSNLFTGTTLPATLINFSGIRQNNLNELQWTVAQELNLLNYELERSNDGIHYTTVAKIAPRNSQVQTTYNYNDAVSAANAEYYYRLKINNDNGTYSYSAVIFIRVVSKNKFAVVGNPFTDYVLLQYTLAKDQKIKADLFSSTGALLRKEEYMATAGNGSYTLNGLGSYPSGVYYLKIESGTERQTFRLVKKP
jgi:hypothetical protein